MNYASLFLVVLLIGCGSCTDEPTPEEDQLGDQLLGHWSLTEATRNGQLTESLQGLFFEFEEPNSLTTNISGAPATVTYKYEEGTISHTLNGIEEDFAVKTLTDSVLVLTTKMRSYPFVFSFERTQQPAPEEGHGEEI